MELWDIRDRTGRPTGRRAERGSELRPGDYHLVVFIILMDEEGRYLISKRAPEKPGAGMWEVVGGSVIAGETSLEGAVREVAEEVGLKLKPEDLTLLERSFFDETHPFMLDIYRYKGPIDPKLLVPQACEVSDIRLMDWPSVEGLMDKGAFFNGPLMKPAYFDQ